MNAQCRTTSLFHVMSNRKHRIRYIAWIVILLSILPNARVNTNTRSTFSTAPFGLVFASGTEVEDKKTERKEANLPSEQSTIAKQNDKSGFKIRAGYVSKESLAGSKQKQPTFSQILAKAGKSGIGGGLPGAIAGVIQVFSLMWLRTIVNYQCRYGTTFRQAIATLYNEGGIPRFYRGLIFALVQAPLARFVSTAANDGVETLLANLESTEQWGPGRTTVIASIVVGMWRMILMPIDTCKTVLQVESVEGFRNLMRKVRAKKFNVLYEGSIANAVSAIASHYPWFYTYNFLSGSSFFQNAFQSNFLRNAVIGFLSSVVSDSVSNTARVIKTTKQSFASKHSVSYSEVVALILAADGWMGLLGRGLRTRILGNAVQSVLFTVVWRGLAEKWNNKKEEQILKEEEESVIEEDFKIDGHHYQY